MKLIRTTKAKLLFQLEKREKALLLDVLRLYPRIPSAYQPLSKRANVPDPQSSQRLLDEALAEQRAENKKRLRTFLEAPSRFQDNEAGFRLALTPAEADWLLQILNDIRVGSWVILGSPEPKAELRLLNERTAPQFWAMEMSGYFQMSLLEGIEGKS